MFKLNLKIALRNLWRNKISSFINISGLAIGLAACLLLLLYVSYEWSFDKQGKGIDDVYQVLINFEDANGEVTGTGTTTPNTIGPSLQQNYQEVRSMCRVDGYGEPKLIANKENSFKKRSRFADAAILQVFEYDFIYGDKKTALAAPNNVIVTESMARLLFGTTDVLNRAVRFEDSIDLKITGVIKDLPENSSIQFDYLLPWTLYESLYDWVRRKEWTNNNWDTFVRLDPSANPQTINQSIKGMIKKHSPDALSSPFLFPFSKLHLYGTFTNGKNTGGEIEQVRLFMGLAIGVLLIACINFMNMATAKSEKRAKEVGVKKTIGASRFSLISQFMMESLVLTVSSAIMAIVLVEAFLPLFNNLLGIKMGISYSNPDIWIGVIGIVVVTGLIAGSYPALYLSSFNPLQILRKRNTRKGMMFISFRQVLVIVQFAFAVILMIATTVIYKQIQFIKDRPTGYEVNDLIEIPQDGELVSKFELLKARLLKSDAVSAVCQLSGSMSVSSSNFWGLEWPGSNEADRHMVFNQLATTYDFVKTTGVTILEGRDFSKQFPSDTAALMLSLSAVKRMNLTHPLGQIVKYQGQNCTVVGVFKDFVWGSPFRTGAPMVVGFNKDWSGNINIRLNHARPASGNIAAIEKIIKEINPAYPVEFGYVDQLYAEKLKSQKILGLLSNIFGGLAIFISCLGLFGLAAFSAEQRTKEIGVRKVLGASVSSLMRLLSFSFIKMVLIAIAIAVPVASYVMDNWLKRFEFHTSVSWIMIVVAAAGTIGIALLTVSFQTYRAAKANPVDALKYE